MLRETSQWHMKTLFSYSNQFNKLTWFKPTRW